MKKKWLLVFMVNLAVLQADGGGVAPFNFSTAQIEKEAVHAQTLVNGASLKRKLIIAGLIAGAGFYIWRTVYKYAEWLQPGTVLVPVFDTKGNPTGKLVVQSVEQMASLGWLEWGYKLIKNAGELSGEFAAGYLVNRYGGPVLGHYLDTIDSSWFLNKNTDIAGLRQTLSEDVILLPLVTQNELIAQRIAIIREKTEMLMADVMRYFGYLQFRQQETLCSDTMCAVKMGQVIQFMQDNTENFCKEFDLLLNEYTAGSCTLESCAQKAAKLETTLVLFFDTLYADINTFGRYENKKA